MFGIPFSLSRLIIAVVIGVVVALLLIGLIGPLLIDLKIDFAVTIGKFLRDFGSVWGLIAAILYYFGAPRAAAT